MTLQQTKSAALTGLRQTTLQLSGSAPRVLLAQLVAHTGATQTADDYIRSNFHDLSGTKVQVRDKGRTVDDTKDQLQDVVFSSKACRLNVLCDPTDVERAKNGRIIKNGQFYPFVDSSGHYEGPGQRAVLSINGAKVRPEGIEIPVPGGKPELAEAIHDVEQKTGKTVLGFRPIDITKGMFAMYYTDTTGDVKIGQFVVKNCPQMSPRLQGPAYTHALADRIHPDILNVVKYYLNK